MSIEKVLKEKFKFNELKDFQSEIINNVLDGNHTLGVIPTGGGKSLTYQLSSQLLDGLTIVISPLLSLMKDQIDFCLSKGIAAGSINSTNSNKENRNIANQIKNNTLDILYLSIEKFKSEDIQNILKEVKISLITIDEAHCISSWGHNFRPEYLLIPNIIKNMNITPTILLLTATARLKVVEDLKNSFNIKKIIKKPIVRNNLKINNYSLKKEERIKFLIKYLTKYKGESSIVYVTKQKEAEDLSEQLNSNGINSKYFHASLDTKIKDDLQDDFMNNKVDVIIATIAFGMGVDKSNIRHVIHFELPKNIEGYSQEIGRAGRDGKDSQCLMLSDAANVNVLENFVYGSTPETDEIKNALVYIDNNIDSLSLYDLSKETNIKMNALKTLLVYLEQVDYIKYKRSFFKDTEIKELKDPTSILKGGASIYNSLLAKGKKGRTKYTFENPIFTTREKDCLDFLEKEGFIEINKKNKREEYLVIKPFRVKSTIDMLDNKFKSQEASGVEKIYSVIDFFKSDQCLNQQLEYYFNNTELKKCNTCSNCLNKSKKIEYTNDNKTINFNFKGSKIEPFLNNKSDFFIKKYLIGLPMPHIGKSLKDIDLYGIYSDIKINNINIIDNEINDFKNIMFYVNRANNWGIEGIVNKSFNDHKLNRTRNIMSTNSAMKEYCNLYGEDLDDPEKVFNFFNNNVLNGDNLLDKLFDLVLKWREEDSSLNELQKFTDEDLLVYLVKKYLIDPIDGMKREYLILNNLIEYAAEFSTDEEDRFMAIDIKVNINNKDIFIQVKPYSFLRAINKDYVHNDFSHMLNKVRKLDKPMFLACVDLNSSKIEFFYYDGVNRNTLNISQFINCINENSIEDLMSLANNTWKFLDKD